MSLGLYHGIEVEPGFILQFHSLSGSHIILLCPLAECGEQAGVIRLFSGSTTSEGEVQYCDDSMWTPVCGDTWGENEAAVACRQLGFAGEGIDTGVC